MTKDKQEAVFQLCLYYAHYTYVMGLGRKDKLYTVATTVSKKAMRYKVPKGNRNRINKYLSYFKKIEEDTLVDNDYISADILLVCLVQYLRSEEQYKELLVMFTDEELLLLIELIENDYKEAYKATQKLIGMFIDYEIPS